MQAAFKHSEEVRWSISDFLQKKLGVKWCLGFDTNPAEPCSRFLTDPRASTNRSHQTSHRHHTLRRCLPLREGLHFHRHPPLDIRPLGRLFHCATFQIVFRPDVSKTPQIFPHLPLSWGSAAVRRHQMVFIVQPRGNLCFERSEHEAVQGERCVVNLNRDVCRCRLLRRSLSASIQSSRTLRQTYCMYILCHLHRAAAALAWLSH